MKVDIRHLWLLAALVSACGGSPALTAPAAPSSSSGPTPTSPITIQGSARDVLTGVPVPAVTLQMPEGVATADASGAFHFNVPSASGTVAVVVTSADTIRRDVRLRVDTNPLQLTLIPSSFDLTAYDEMARPSGVLYRWTSAPALVVQRAVLTFTSVTDSQFVAADDVMSASDADALADTLSSLLPQFTGNLWQTFSSRSVQLASPGSPVNVNMSNTLVVARCAGLTAGTGYAGYTRWTRFGNVLSQAVTLLDNDYDNRANTFRTQLRAHEFGHALGYSHVTTRTSVMNNPVTSFATPFDLATGTIAYLRPPGNAAPDADPANITVNAGRPYTHGTP